MNIQTLTAADLKAAAENLLAASGLDEANDELDLLPAGEQILSRFEDRFGLAGGIRLVDFAKRLHQLLQIEAELELA